MKKRTALAFIVLVLLLLAGGGYYVYSQGVRIVKREVEREQARVARLNNGSVLEWSDYRVDGLHVVFNDFHYLDTNGQTEITAETLRATTRFGKLYDLDLTNAVINIGKYDQFSMDEASLKRFNDPETYADFVVDAATFKNLKWADQSGTGANLVIENSEINGLGNLQIQKAEFLGVNANFPSSKTSVSAGDIILENLRLIQGKSGQVNGFLYEVFSMPMITANWHDKPIAKGSIQSTGAYESGTNFLESGQFLGNFEFMINQDDIRKFSQESPEIDSKNERFLLALAQDDIYGTMKIEANLDKGGVANLAWITDFENLGRLEINSLFNGYRARALRDFTNNPDIVFSPEVGKLPDSFSDLVLVETRIDYQDDQLANIYLDNFANIDPALVSFLAQMTLPQYLPNDRELVRESATAFSDFLRDRNSFTLSINPDEPIAFEELILLFQSRGPYKETLRITIEGQ